MQNNRIFVSGNYVVDNEYSLGQESSIPIQTRETDRLAHDLFLLEYITKSANFQTHLEGMARRITKVVNLEAPHIDVLISWPPDITSTLLDYLYIYAGIPAAMRYTLSEKEEAGFMNGIIKQSPTIQQIHDKNPDKIVFLIESHDYNNIKMRLIDLLLKQYNISYFAICCTQSIGAAEFNPRLIIGSVSTDLLFFLERLTGLLRTAVDLKLERPITIIDQDSKPITIPADQISENLRGKYEETENLLLLLKSTIGIA